MSITSDRLIRGVSPFALLSCLSAVACVGQLTTDGDTAGVDTGLQGADADGYGALKVTLLAGTDGAGPSVQTPAGTFPAAAYEGQTIDGVAAFRGIRFAKPPIGELRWSPPVAPEATEGTIDAKEFGSACPQLDSPFGEASTDEDCLFLNVYVPEGAAQRGRLPVMVFYYGGAFVSGAASLYNPAQLVTEGNVIVITVNYRLGVLGYMASPELSRTSAEGVSGNYGLRDQKLALQWVQQNVGAFGGNPRNVTIFGESAGGFSVCAMLTMPSARGLFSRAITESGPCAFPLPELSASQQVGTDFTRAANCQAPNDADTVACLRALSTEQLLEFQPSSSELLSSPNGLTAFFPNVDGKLLQQQPLTALTLGDFNRVPVIVGTNRDEGTLFIALTYDILGGAPLTAEQYPQKVADTARALATRLGGDESSLTQQILAEYPLSNYTSPGQALAAVLGDGTFSCPAASTAQLLALNVATYQYEFADRSAPMSLLPPASFAYGATHTAELQYLFTQDAERAQLSADQQELAGTMRSYWTRFAATGMPSPRLNRAYWPAYSLLNPNIQGFIAPEPAPRPDFAGDHHCDFWNRILLQGVLGG